jgi:mannose-6-phosphate isomerase
MGVVPLIFEPIFKPRIWGGRRLATLLDKDLPDGETIGESWELADLEDEQSVVATGPMKGKTLGELVRDWGSDLTGRAPLFEGHFPLLIKFLDARETLSVQVHPDQEMANRLGGRVRVKNESWYIVDTDSDGFIYRGLKPGVDHDALRRAIEEKRVESVLERISVRKDHAYYLPSGTIHALGAGVLVAEVQTPSDITYRVYDWDRVDGKTGRPRDLHLEQAMACISLAPVPPETEHPQHVASVWTSVTRLVGCESFVIERVRMAAGVEQPIPHAELVIWMVLEGRGEVECKGSSEPLAFKRGDTVLLPAALRDGVVRAQEKCMWLEVTVPIESSLAGYERPDREGLRSIMEGGQGLVPLNVPSREGGSSDRTG